MLVLPCLPQLIHCFCCRKQGHWYHATWSHFYHRTNDQPRLVGRTLLALRCSYCRRWGDEATDLLLGTWHDELWPDNWTAVTVDGKRSAQFEETLLVTETGVEVSGLMLLVAESDVMLS